MCVCVGGKCKVDKLIAHLLIEFIVILDHKFLVVHL